MKFLRYEEVLQSVEQAVSVNSQIATGIYEAGCLALSEVTNSARTSTWHGIATEEDFSNTRACIRGLFRDWSNEGAPERIAAHTPVLNTLRTELSRHEEDKASFRVLVPGAGLGRLVHSISDLGTSVESIDISYHTLLTCLYLFGGRARNETQTLYPWALGFSNHVSRQDQLRGVQIPDLCLSNPIKVACSPLAASREQQIVLKSGGFVETYGGQDEAESFSALVTCYFIDTAPDFLAYINTAWNCLKPGGIWINIGPLLWNITENGPGSNGYSDQDEQEAWKASRQYTESVYELAGEEILRVLQAKGFIIEQSSNSVGSSMYVGNRASLMQYHYDQMFWVVRKPRQRASL